MYYTLDQHIDNAAVQPSLEAMMVPWYSIYSRRVILQGAVAATTALSFLQSRRPASAEPGDQGEPFTGVAGNYFVLNPDGSQGALLGRHEWTTPQLRFFPTDGATTSIVDRTEPMIDNIPITRAYRTYAGGGRDLGKLVRGGIYIPLNFSLFPLGLSFQMQETWIMVGAGPQEQISPAMDMFVVFDESLGEGGNKPKTNESLQRFFDQLQR
jgi:hypothetical protein